MKIKAERDFVIQPKLLHVGDCLKYKAHAFPIGTSLVSQSR